MRKFMCMHHNTDTMPNIISEFVDQFYRFDLPMEIAYNTLRDSLSSGQMKSKLNLLEVCNKLSLNSQFALFIGHWHGLLPRMMYEKKIINKAVGIEKNLLWSQFSNKYLAACDWKSQNIDVSDFQNFNSFDLIINTSCEHMSSEWILKVPVGCKLLLQSTNYQHPEHTHSQSSIDDFKSTLPNVKIISEDVLDCEVYKRFTIFGVKE
jgi:hypothetical protein